MLSFEFLRKMKEKKNVSDYLCSKPGSNPGMKKKVEYYEAKHATDLGYELRHEQIHS